MSGEINVIDEYADLPAWARPGAKVAVESWADSSSYVSVYTGIVVRATKTRVVVKYRTRGEYLESWVARNATPGSTYHLARYGQGGGIRLHDPVSPKVADLYAVQRLRLLRQQIDALYAERREPITKGDNPAKHLRDAADALALLDEIADLVRQARTTVLRKARTAGIPVDTDPVKEG